MTTYCEWKGVAAYFDVAVDGRVFEAAAWTYPNPFEEYRALTDLIAFYPHALECRVNNKRVLPQEGQVYAGWITSDLSGPFKGAPGTEDW